MKIVIIQLEEESGYDGVPNNLVNQEVWGVDDAMDPAELHQEWLTIHWKLRRAWTQAHNKKQADESERLKEYQYETYARYLQREAGAELLTFYEHVL